MKLHEALESTIDLIKLNKPINFDLLLESEKIIDKRAYLFEHKNIATTLSSIHKTIESSNDKSTKINSLKKILLPFTDLHQHIHSDTTIIDFSQLKPSVLDDNCFHTELSTLAQKEKTALPLIDLALKIFNLLKNEQSDAYPIMNFYMIATLSYKQLSFYLNAISTYEDNNMDRLTMISPPYILLIVRYFEVLKTYYSQTPDLQDSINNCDTALKKPCFAFSDGLFKPQANIKKTKLANNQLNIKNPLYDSLTCILSNIKTRTCQPFFVNGFINLCNNALSTSFKSFNIKKDNALNALHDQYTKYQSRYLLLSLCAICVGVLGHLHIISSLIAIDVILLLGLIGLITALNIMMSPFTFNEKPLTKWTINSLLMIGFIVILSAISFGLHLTLPYVIGIVSVGCACLPAITQYVNTSLAKTHIMSNVIPQDEISHMLKMHQLDGFFSISTNATLNIKQHDALKL